MPPELEVILLGLAIVDDIGAILVTAAFDSGSLQREHDDGASLHRPWRAAAPFRREAEAHGTIPDPDPQPSLADPDGDGKTDPYRVQTGG